MLPVPEGWVSVPKDNDPKHTAKDTDWLKKQQHRPSMSADLESAEDLRKGLKLERNWAKYLWMRAPVEPKSSFSCYNMFLFNITN